MMENLKNYTDEQLREELKRRAQEKRKNMKNEIEYIEFYATVVEVDNRLGYKRDGKIKYKPFTFWKYRVKDCSYDFAERHSHIDTFYLKQDCFKRDNAPQIGDRVKLRYRKTKSASEVFNLCKARIIEIIKKGGMNKVGDIVDYNGVKLKVVLCDIYNYCGNCFFNKASQCKAPPGMSCTQLLREDNNSVKYVKIE